MANITSFPQILNQCALKEAVVIYTTIHLYKVLSLCVLCAMFEVLKDGVEGNLK